MLNCEYLIVGILQSFVSLMPYKKKKSFVYVTKKPSGTIKNTEGNRRRERSEFQTNSILFRSLDSFRDS